jgi:hypothetical protein
MESNRYERKIPESVYFYELDKDWWAGPFVKPPKDYDCVEYRLVPVNKEEKITAFSPELNEKANLLIEKGENLKKEVTDLLHPNANDIDMTELINNAYTDINTIIKRLERIDNKETQEWIKKMLIREIGRNVEITCDDSNNPPSALDHKVLVAHVYYRVNNSSSVFERELVFGKTENILQYKADLLV